MTRGELLKQLRIENGFTQEYVAEKLQMHHSTINKYENDKINISTPTLEKLAALYNVKTSDLFDVNENTSIDPFKALKGAIKATKETTEISNYSNLPDDLKARLTEKSLEALKLYYNSL